MSRTLCLPILLVLAASTPTFAQTDSVLFSFGGQSDGSEPHAGLTPSPGGSFYGTVPGGGLGSGLVYQLLPPAQAGGQYTELPIYQFPLSDGPPSGGVLLTTAGSLFVMTGQGGVAASGSIIELTPPTIAGASWVATTVYSFLGGVDGKSPAGTLIEDQFGNLFGATAGGGVNTQNEKPGAGTIFELDPPATAGGSWAHRVLHLFRGSDGAEPRAGVVMGKSGALYGTTLTGGSDQEGVVFEVSPPASAAGEWQELVLHSFQGFGDGARPYAGVVMDAEGSLYGQTTVAGSTVCSCGSVFEISPQSSGTNKWKYAVLAIFTQFVGGVGNLAIGSGGVVYGGADTLIYSLTPPVTRHGAWGLATVYTFKGPPDEGSGLPSGLLYTDGAIYGTTQNGGSLNHGTAFRLTL